MRQLPLEGERDGSGDCRVGRNSGGEGAPHVAGAFNYLLVDECDPYAFQSGLLRPDGGRLHGIERRGLGELQQPAGLLTGQLLQDHGDVLVGETLHY